MGKVKEMFHEEREQYDERSMGNIKNLPVKKPAEETGLTLSTKKLLDFTKSDIREFAMAMVSSVEDDKEDLIETMIQIKKAKLFFDELEDNLKDRFYAKNFVSKGEVYKAHNVEIEPAEFGSWDYKNCNDEILIRLDEEIKQRRAVLKMITTPTKSVDMATGSEYVANPPIKKTTSGYKITINA